MSHLTIGKCSRLPGRMLWAFGLALAANLHLAAPAAAVDARQAIRKSDRNPKCNFTVDGGDGGITVTVGDNLITCPRTLGGFLASWMVFAPVRIPA